MTIQCTTSVPEGNHLHVAAALHWRRPQQSKTPNLELVLVSVRLFDHFVHMLLIAHAQCPRLTHHTQYMQCFSQRIHQDSVAVWLLRHLQSTFSLAFVFFFFFF